MRKYILPALYVVGSLAERTQPPKINIRNLASVSAGQNEGETPDELTTWNYDIEKITEFEVDEIVTYW